MASRLVINADLGQFNASWGAGRHVARSADGTWFYAFQDGVNGRVVWQSHAGLVDIPLSPQPTMRPTLYADPTGLYCVAGFDGDKKHILIWYIEEYKTVYKVGGDDLRVDALIGHIATLTQQMAEMETALANISAPGGMSAADTELLRRLRAFLLPLLGA